MGPAGQVDVAGSHATRRAQFVPGRLAAETEPAKIGGEVHVGELFWQLVGIKTLLTDISST